MATNVDKLTKRLLRTVDEFTDEHELDYPARVRAFTGALAGMNEKKREYDLQQQGK